MNKRYDFTGSSVDGAAFVPIFTEMVKKTVEVGLKPVFVTNDKGTSNVKMWK